MRRYGLLPKYLVLFAAAAVSVSLSGCAGMPGTSGASLNSDQLAEAVKSIAMDPNCGHTDTLNVILGPVPSGSLFLQRLCPSPAAKAAATVVGVSTTSFDNPAALPPPS